MTESISELLARSSIGGHAWCANCKHADLNHWGGSCHSTEQIQACTCPGLRRMTPEEWLVWKGYR